jgi:hypothetical protein
MAKKKAIDAQAAKIEHLESENWFLELQNEELKKRVELLEFDLKRGKKWVREVLDRYLDTVSDTIVEELQYWVEYAGEEEEE